MIKITSEDINDNRKTKSVFKKNGASYRFKLMRHLLTDLTKHLQNVKF